MGIIASLVISTNGTTTTYYLTDAQGSVLTALSASAIVGQQIYGPYGNTRYQVGTMGTTKGYTGQFHDAVSGLDYYNARYYDPVTGEFLSADMVQGNAQGANPYVYVSGNPETEIDPNGLCGFSNWGDFGDCFTQVAKAVINVVNSVEQGIKNVVHEVDQGAQQIVQSAQQHVEQVIIDATKHLPTWAKVAIGIAIAAVAIAVAAISFAAHSKNS